MMDKPTDLVFNSSDQKRFDLACSPLPVCAPHLDGRVHLSSSYYVDDYLYDLKNDPYELNNLVKDPIYTQVKDDLRKRLTAWIFESEHMEATITDA
jgi:hypothetical protein